MTTKVTPVIPYQEGNAVSSKLVTVTSLDRGDSDVNAWSGRAYGFILQPTGVIRSPNTAQSPFAFLKIRGIGQKSNDIIPVVPNQFYAVPFDRIDFCGDPDGLLTIEGEWIVAVALQPYVTIAPSSNATPVGFPAQSGGVPSFVLGGEVQALTRAAPTLITEGTAIGSASMYAVQIEALTNNITGGVIDLYRSRWAAGTPLIWDLVAQGIPIPLGRPQARLPVDRFGPHTYVERFIACTNGVTLSGAETEVTVRWLFQ